MKCQFCDAAATVHLTDIVNHAKREMHLCDACAREQNLIPDSSSPQINLQSLLQLILGSGTATDSPEAAPDPARLTCPGCGIKYAQFRADGRLGCPHDYDAFRPHLEPLLQRVHRGRTHAGKVPRVVRRGRVAADLAGLRAELLAAVVCENYEAAARIRDAIRQKESAE
jgi:protein arginine kinase activator